MDTKALTVDQFSRTYGVGRTKVFEEIKSGRLQTYCVGRSRYISARAAQEWQLRLEAETSQQEAPGVAA